MNDDKTAITGRQAIAQIMKPIRGRLWVAAVLAAIGAGLALAPLAGIVQIAGIALAEQTMGYAAPPFNRPAHLEQITILSLLCLFAGVALLSSAELLAHLADHRLTDLLRRKIARRLTGVPLGWFTERASGEVKQALQDDVGTLHELAAHYYTTSGRLIGTIVVAVGYLFLLDWRLALISLLPYLGFYLLFGCAKRAISHDSMSALAAGQARINSSITEFIHGIPVVKAFGAAGKAHGAYREAVDAFLEAFLRFTQPLVVPMANANAMAAPLTVLSFALTTGVLFVFMEWSTPVDVLPFILVAPCLSGPLLMLSFISHGVANGIGAAQRVRLLLNTPLLPWQSTEATSSPRPALGTRICFEQVSYAYGSQGSSLSNVSFTAESGKLTAVVGASGSGKSTLARLLVRFFDPSAGRITLGGVDLRDMAEVDLYRHIGFVLQEVKLIHATVSTNIALGRPSASAKEIEAAARAANIHERIQRLPRGYDSVVGEDAHLSGGEQQRLCIARAVLLDAPVLLLDEATSASDAGNQAAVHQALRNLAGERTLLVIAHRLDTIMHADHIVVLENGAVIEQGRHQELLALGGRYSRLWTLGAAAHTAEKEMQSC